MPKRPNILFLMSDEHRPDFVGFENDPVVRTPVLDRLARDGAVFRNAYTPSPICIPARQCLMAGQLPRTCRCEGWVDLAPGYQTFARSFSEYAYETVVCGKLHHLGQDQMQGWTQRPAGIWDIQVTPENIPGRNKQEWERHSRPLGEVKWSDVEELQRAGPAFSPCYIRDRQACDSALLFIEEYFNSPIYDRQKRHQPLFLKVSFTQPHFPYFTHPDLFNYYLNRVNPYFDKELFPHPILSQHRVRPGVDVSHRAIQRAVAAYYGMIETIDQWYGEVIDKLAEVGENLDDWIILYTSDHGEMLGEHQVWLKQKFFEASARVPLVIRWPKGFEGGRVLHENVNLCDLFATLCDLAEIPTPEGLDSRSLGPLLRGEKQEWDNVTYSQFQDNLMIKRDHLKYQSYGPEIPEVLFDLSADPKETTNWIDSPGYADAVKDFREQSCRYWKRAPGEPWLSV